MLQRAIVLTLFVIASAFVSGYGLGLSKGSMRTITRTQIVNVVPKHFQCPETIEHSLWYADKFHVNYQPH